MHANLFVYLVILLSVHDITKIDLVDLYSNITIINLLLLIKTHIPIITIINDRLGFYIHYLKL